VGRGCPISCPFCRFLRLACQTCEPTGSRSCCAFYTSRTAVRSHRRLRRRQDLTELPFGTTSGRPPRTIARAFTETMSVTYFWIEMWQILLWLFLGNKCALIHNSGKSSVLPDTRNDVPSNHTTQEGIVVDHARIKIDPYLVLIPGSHELT
jgi:hypothetical protein